MAEKGRERVEALPEAKKKKQRQKKDRAATHATVKETAAALWPFLGIVFSAGRATQVREPR